MAEKDNTSHAESSTAEEPDLRRPAEPAGPPPPPPADVEVVASQPAVLKSAEPDRRREERPEGRGRRRRRSREGQRRSRRGKTPKPVAASRGREAGPTEVRPPRALREISEREDRDKVPCRQCGAMIGKSGSKKCLAHQRWHARRGDWVACLTWAEKEYKRRVRLAAERRTAWTQAGEGPQSHAREPSLAPDSLTKKAAREDVHEPRKAAKNKKEKKHKKSKAVRPSSSRTLRPRGASAAAIPAAAPALRPGARARCTSMCMPKPLRG